MISDVTSTGMCIIEFIQTEEHRRVGMPPPFERHEASLSFLNNCSLGSELFSLDWKEQTLTVACLWFILLLDLIMCKVPCTYQNPDSPSSDASFQNITALLQSFVVFPLSLRIKSTLTSLASSPSISFHTAPKWRQDSAAVKATGSDFRRPRLTFQLHHLRAWAHYVS